MFSIADFIPIIIIGVIIIGLAVLFSFIPVALWISALAAGVKVSIFTLVGMRLRRVVPSKVINPLIKAYKAGVSADANPAFIRFLKRRYNGRKR